MAQILRFLIQLMLIAILYTFGRWLGIPMDIASLVQDLIFTRTIQPNSVIFLVFLIGSVIVVIATTNQVSDWVGSQADPLKPQKIELFTKETPAQIVGAANAAMTNIVLMFIGVAIVFF